jgi:ATP-dependent Lhr-like helicase
VLGPPAPAKEVGSAAASDSDRIAEAEADRLLLRYGVVFRDLLARENLITGWREVHRALRRLEARGVVRGGRFVTGFIGEQFALPEAIPGLRRERSRAPEGLEIRISSSDPLNLAGILTPGPRVQAGSSAEIRLKDGEFVVAEAKHQEE